MWEVALSEFHIPVRDFWFFWSIPRLVLLIDAYSERNETDDTQDDAPRLSTADEMEDLLRMNNW